MKIGFKEFKKAMKVYWNAFLVLIGVGIVLYAGTALWVYGQEAYAKLFPVPTYAEFLMKNLSIGDVTSTECGNLGQKIEQQDTTQNLEDGDGILGSGLYSPNLQFYTYLYNKHRCIGETSEAVDGAWSNGQTDSIVDLATNKVLVSCTFDETVSPARIDCTDYITDPNGSNTWDSESPDTNSTESQSPYPIFSNTYVELEKLGGS